MEQIERLEAKTPLTQTCLDHIVAQYQVNPLVLTLIANNEGGWSGARVKNNDGTFDMGLMQINTIHLPELSRYGITETMLVNNDCINVGVAAWYVRRVTHGISLATQKDYFRAIARYHNKSEPHISVYAEKLSAVFERLVKQYGSIQ